MSAVYADFEDHDRRNKSIVIHGLRSDDAGDKEAVQKLLNDEFSLSTTTVRYKCLGQPQKDKIHPLLAVLTSMDVAESLIRDDKRLRRSTNQCVKSSVFINADLTKAEALAAYNRRCQRRVSATRRGRARTAVNPIDQAAAAAAEVINSEKSGGLTTPITASSPSDSHSN